MLPDPDPAVERLPGPTGLTDLPIRSVLPVPPGAGSAQPIGVARVPVPVVLLGLAVGIDVWALQTYGLRVEPDLDRFHLVLCLAHLPAVMVAVRAATGTGRGLVRALLPSLLIVSLWTGVGAVVASTGPLAAGPATSELVGSLPATVWAWLGAGLVTRSVAARMERTARTARSSPLTGAELVLRLGAGAVLVALGLAMPATSRGLLGRDRLGMVDQVRAVLTGYGDPAAVHLVTTYALLLACGCCWPRCSDSGLPDSHMARECARRRRGRHRYGEKSVQPAPPVWAAPGLRDAWVQWLQRCSTRPIFQ